MLQLHRLILLCIALGPMCARGGAQPAPRTFDMGFSDFPPNFGPAAQDLVYEKMQGRSDLVSHYFQEGIPWIEASLSSDTTTYPLSLQEKWADLRGHDIEYLPNAARCIGLNPIDVDYVNLAPLWGESSLMPLPAPWNTYAFNHPDVKRAFVNYAIGVVEYFDPKYLNIAVEANILLARNVGEWVAFLDLQAHTYVALKTRYPELKVFISIQYEHMKGLHADSIALQEEFRETYPDILVDQVRALMLHSDVLALSAYPYMVYQHPIGEDYLDAALAVAGQTGKPLAIEQTGFISQDLEIPPGGYFLTGTPAQQEWYVDLILSEAQAHGLLFVSLFVAMDYGTNFGNNFLFMTWAYAGLFGLDEQPKPALQTWDGYFSRRVLAAGHWTLYR